MMGQTPFLPEQKVYSDQINDRYKDLIYPPAYGLKGIDAIYDEDAIPEEIRTYLDTEQGIDFSFWLKFPNFKHPMKFTSQYRYRDATNYQRYQDLTITLLNNASGKPGELSKLLALLFVYGYYDYLVNRLVEVIVTDCQRMRNCILDGSLKPKEWIPENTRSDQPFLCFDFDELKRLDLVLLHWREIDGKPQRLRTTIDPPTIKGLPYYGNGEEI
jgi:hypothetical protein